MTYYHHLLHAILIETKNTLNFHLQMFRIWAVCERRVVELIIYGVKKRIGPLAAQVALGVVQVYGPHHHPAVPVLLDVARLKHNTYHY